MADFDPFAILDPSRMEQQIVSGGGGGGGPFPFFGTRGTSAPWSRPSATGFSTWLNRDSGVSNASVEDNAGGLPLVLSGAPDSTDYLLTAVLKSAPTPPWTITTLQGAWGTETATIYPIVVRDSNTDKALALVWSMSPSLGVLIQILAYPNTGHNAAFNALDNGHGAPPVADYIIWSKLHFDGAAFTWQIGPDGFLWSDPIIVSGDSGFLATIDQVGFGIERANTDAGSGLRGTVSAILWNWVES